MIRFIVFTSLLLTAFAGAVQGEPRAQYSRYCAECHGADRLGGTGPALIPETLKRMRGPKLGVVIAEGRAATQMPGFADTLSPDEIAALGDYLTTSLAKIPDWGPGQIEQTRTLDPDYVPVTAPAFDADPLNLFLVVETGDHHVSVVDGDSFTVLDRFPTPFAVHGGPKFTPDGRFVFIMSRDGWVQKYDLWSLAEIGRVRAGLNSRNIAISKDGKHLAVANYLPRTLTILATADLSVEKVFEVADKDGTPSRVSAVYQAPQRDSFILALKDAPEIWEIATDPNAAPVYEGYVHSYEKGMVEAIAGSEGLFALRRIAVTSPLDDFFFTPDYRHLIGAARDGERGVVVNLTVGREIAELPLPGLPHLGSGISWIRDGRRVMATPHLKQARLSVIDIETWQVVKTIETLGPGFFLRSHENSRYVWADVFFGPNRDAMHVIDKQTLEIVKTLRPVPGATVAHVEFDRDGKYALVSVWEDEGAVIVYDAQTLEEVTRLPMRKPSGKYNVWNKISFSDGTSH
ncbi:cytochrome D1 domain-containing protein [Aurantimonas sp. C2-6-R+9]|uniref:cytochrome D1 domain-containing protein n=1 Tax=unclassified Aurantimonas TaxID=2638230 RepID=UPI002E172D66|nr:MULTISPECIES: cytochrome D1 domain-containing protein [unclassified Aurantimonas]MEC5290937.1 cytochrome D1 domain-containing protein [Aurantimonas sp. C2-3-R2]MEC5381308.1 cytochrome D1 domain-containing protein [Aurantimonas sp. C2-6-R+9]MEC5412131.1 cytochrome D1 domain-containing protein [Aurantimonas sp. C2-4-R8]